MIHKYAVGMVFGVFDGLHEGHRYFLAEASKYCEKLIVVVAHPKIVLSLKRHSPHHNLEERIDAIRQCNDAYEVIAGDRQIGTWSALKRYQPDIVLLGYDQRVLGDELKKIGIRYVFISSHHPDKYKSSLILKKTKLTI